VTQHNVFDSAETARAVLNGQHHPGNGTDDEACATPGWLAKLAGWTPPKDILTRSTAVTWAVEDWIGAGLVGALVSSGGTGKTTLLLVLGISIALGRPFFGHRVKKGSFLLLSADDTQQNLDAALTLILRAMRVREDEANIVAGKLRLISLVGEDGDFCFTTTVRGAVTATGVEDLIHRAVAGVTDLVGFACDTVRQFSGGSTNDEQVIKLTIAACTRLAHKTGAFGILPHHTGKQNFRDGVDDLYCGSGSAAIGDNCRFVLLLMVASWLDIEQQVERTGQEHGDPLVLMSTRGSILVKKPAPMFLCRDGYAITRIAGRSLTKDQQADERDRAVLRAVRNGATTKNKIACVVKGKRMAALARIDDLEGRGHLILAPAESGSRSGSQKYMVTGTGAKFLDDRDGA